MTAKEWNMPLKTPLFPQKLNIIFNLDPLLARLEQMFLHMSLIEGLFSKELLFKLTINNIPPPMKQWKPSPPLFMMSSVDLNPHTLKLLGDHPIQLGTSRSKEINPLRPEESKFPQEPHPNHTIPRTVLQQWPFNKSSDLNPASWRSSATQLEETPRPSLLPSWWHLQGTLLQKEPLQHTNVRFPDPVYHLSSNQPPRPDQPGPPMETFNTSLLSSIHFQETFPNNRFTTASWRPSQQQRESSYSPSRRSQGPSLQWTLEGIPRVEPLEEADPQVMMTGYDRADGWNRGSRPPGPPEPSAGHYYRRTSNKKKDVRTYVDPRTHYFTIWRDTISKSQLDLSFRISTLTRELTSNNWWSSGLQGGLLPQKTRNPCSGCLTTAIK